MIFNTFLFLIILQRIVELIYARKNEKWMRARGAVEAGQKHYKWIVTLHILFFISLLLETAVDGRELAPGWEVFMIYFGAAQLLRIWSLTSLGPYWNTKIFVLPGEKRIARGPYRWISHPNYLVVMVEIASLPLIFGAWRTALIFSAANAVMLFFIRIPAEDKALKLYVQK
ncbi:isoprenylcysteine carboxyl methyltransferase family protein [Alteribacillus sp. HJP-4]|uniref:isoprenylcysteine carboxyl methyltransferase family protein n=1 Tax=Alteribacillus sp. HJP-4 TaxID=2775394 RepID=UPI0035CCE797